MLDHDLVKHYESYNIFIGDVLDSSEIKKQQKDYYKGANEEKILDGVCIAVKDNINVKGFRTSAGTKALQNYAPDHDAVAIKKLRDAGAIIIGKLNMHELAFGVTSDNYHFGRVKNPLDQTLIAGGSSGGSAAVVAAGIVKIALGTDTGGSCRIPASLCGVYGFRPTTKRYSSDGVVPLAHSRDTIGLLGDNLRDMELVDGVIANDVGLTPLQFKFRKLYTFGTKIRLGVSKHYFFSSLSDEVQSEVDKMLHKLSFSNKIELVYADMVGIEDLRKHSFHMFQHEVSADLPQFLEEYNTGVSIEQLIEQITSPDVEKIIKDARRAFIDGETLESYSASLKEAVLLRNLYEKFLDEHKLDALIYPTTPIEAKSIEELNSSFGKNDGKGVDTIPLYFPNTDAGAQAGIPSISLPLCKLSNGRPIGIQLETFANHDQQLFQIAKIVTEAVTEID